MMTENTNPTNTISVGDGTSEPALPKSSTVTLTAHGSTMQIVAERKADGSAKTYVVTTGADKKSARGMSATHADFEAAKLVVAGMVKAAAKLGWQRKDRQGFVAKPDAFSTLPAAPKAKK